MTDTFARTQDWYNEWFSSPYWHILYKNRNREEAQQFIDELSRFLALRQEDEILDLACGKGRHAIYLNKQGLDVTGIDISPTNIDYANRFANERLRFFVHDLRDTFAPGYFDYVLNLFTSFGYFETDEEHLTAIEAIAGNLKQGGKLVIDFMNVDKVVRELVPYAVKEVKAFRFEITKTVQNGFIFKDINFQDGEQVFHFQERVKLIAKRDFERYFRAANLRITQVFGDYQLQPFDAATSDRMIFVVEK